MIFDTSNYISIIHNFIIPFHPPAKAYALAYACQQMLSYVQAGGQATRAE